MFVRLIRPAVSLLVLMTVLLGIVYPLVITGVAKVAFPRQAEGSLIYQDGKLIGSTLDRPEFLGSEVLLGPAVRHQPSALQRPGLGGLELGPAQPRVARCGQGERQSAARCRS